jgi:predicted DNA-binding transcriptional regulator AlpA
MARTKSSASTLAFLSIEEVATLRGEHRSNCYRSIERGDFPVPVVTINGRLRVPRVLFSDDLLGTRKASRQIASAQSQVPDQAWGRS